jgi:hypothetical protein
MTESATAQPSSPRRRATTIAVLGTLAVLAAAAAFLALRQNQEPVRQKSIAQALMEVRSETCSGRDLKGTGVRMEVFASSDLSSAPLQEGLVPVLDLNVTPRTPVQPGQTVRWTGWIKGPESGKHRFHLPAGVSGTLTISNTDIITPVTADSAGMQLEKSRFYSFTLVVPVDKAAADAGTWLLSWSNAAQEPQPVTRGFLFPPSNVVGKPINVATKS